MNSSGQGVSVTVRTKKMSSIVVTGCRSLQCEKMRCSWRHCKWPAVGCIYGAWPTSTKLDLRRKHISNIPHLKGAHYLNFLKMSWSRAEICSQNEIQNAPSGCGILLLVPILTSVILRRPSYVSLYKISRKSLNTRLSHCDSTFYLHAFKPTLPTAERHSAYMQAIYTNITNINSISTKHVVCVDFMLTF